MTVCANPWNTCTSVPRVDAGLVAHPRDGDHLAAADDRDGHLTQDGGVPRRQPLAVLQRGVVVVDDRFAGAEAVHPDPGLGDRVGFPFPSAVHILRRVLVDQVCRVSDSWLSSTK